MQPVLLTIVVLATNLRVATSMALKHQDSLQYRAAYPFVLIDEMRRPASNRTIMVDHLDEVSNGLFCFMLVYNPPEETFDLVHKQLQQCDEFRIYSNFTDEARNIVELPELGVFAPSPVSEVNFRLVWKQLGRDREIQKYQWIAKFEADTLFYPRKLKRALLEDQIDISQNIIAGDLRGPAEVISQGAFQTFVANQQQCYDEWIQQHGILAQEDM